GEGLAAEISRDPDRTGGSSRGVVIRRGEVQLRLGGGRIARMDRPVDGSGRESSHRSTGTQPKVPIDRGRSGAGDRGSRQDRERGRRSKRNGRLARWRGGGGKAPDKVRGKRVAGQVPGPGSHRGRIDGVGSEIACRGQRRNLADDIIADGSCYGSSSRSCDPQAGGVDR